ncbi:MAG: proline--tRNA ligase [Ignavibacteria bacterium]|nr:proline--tRNA ligase [Ignavibacteria bacterium]
MKLSKNFIPTLKELPADALMPSHQLMLRAGMIRQLAAGVFTFLPFGYRVLKKVINILREEIDAIGGQEFFMPALNPIEIWEQTNRVEAMGDVMFHIKNRDGLVLAPTHEEIITFHARQHIQSYKVLPQIWYQIQTKFRNEPRPKSGIMRGRQFFMKDAYSLDSSWEGLDISYQKHYEAYKKIFDRCNIKYFIVGASSGAMGGKQSQEFMVESEFGEDTCAVCEKCDYAANLEVASSKVEPCGRIDNDLQIEAFPTPNAKTIDELIEQFNLSEDRLAKSVVYIADSKPVLILMLGNDELNETKLQVVLAAAAIRPAEPNELLQYTGANAGSIGPVNLKENIKIIADNRLLGANNMVSGANKDGFHNKNIDLERDAKIDGYFDLRVAQSGESCPNCGAPIKIVNAIELGHIFKLGTRYSEALGATFLDEKGEEHPIIMGSYGIGVERIIACFIETHHDDKGIIWKKPLNPFDAHLLGLNMNKFEEVKELCDNLYEELRQSGIDLLYDDRNESPGVKFNDADLLGIPYQIIVSKKNIEAGCVEVKIRETGERKQVKINEIIKLIREQEKQ